MKFRLYVALFIFIFFLAIFLRLYSINNYHGVSFNGMFSEPLYGDEAAYYELGRNVYLGEGPVEYVIWDLWAHNNIPHLHSFYPPFFAYLIGPLFYIFGESTFVIRLFMLIISLSTVILTYYIGAKIYDKKIGLLAMFFMAINPFHVFHSGLIMIETLFTFLVTLSITFAYFAISKGKLVHWIFLGIFLGLSTITRYFGFLLLISLLLILIIRWRKINWKYFCYFAAIFILVILPVGIQTYKEFGTPFYSTSIYMKYVDHRLTYYEPVKPSFDSYFGQPISKIIYDRLYGVGRILTTLPRIFNPFIFAFLFLSILFIDKFIFLSLGLFFVFNSLLVLSIGPGYLIGERYLIYFVPVLYVISSVAFYKILFDKKFDEKYKNIVVIIILMLTFVSSLAMIQYQTNDYPNPENRKILGFNDLDLSLMGKWIRDNIPEEAVVMSDSTYLLRYFSNRSVVFNPYIRTSSTDPEKLSQEAKNIHIEQVKRFNVSYLLIEPKGETSNENILFGFNSFKPILLHKEGNFSLYRINPESR